MDILTKAALITLSIIPGAMAGEPLHCVSGTDDYGITTTQCDNGTVTITNGKKEQRLFVLLMPASPSPVRRFSYDSHINQRTP